MTSAQCSPGKTSSDSPSPSWDTPESLPPFKSLSMFWSISQQASAKLSFNSQPDVLVCHQVGKIPWTTLWKTLKTYDPLKINLYFVIYILGGLANLSPRLTIVRKIDAGDGSYPSVNTCVHYLKLPDYSTEQVMKERLLTATREKGFHLN